MYVSSMRQLFPTECLRLRNTLTSTGTIFSAHRLIVA
jgi:hypothetical protein